MAPKKPSRRKLDLTNLASLNTNITPEPEKTVEEQPTPEQPATSEAIEQPATSEAVDTPVSPPEKPAPVPPEEARTERRQFDKKPQRAEVKPLKTLQSVTNSAGATFKPGDKIQLMAPWGKRAIAEITMIYQDNSDNAWAQYLPAESIPPNWTWLGGCARVERLVAAE